MRVDSSPPKNEDGSSWGQEVPHEGLRAQQPVHVHGPCCCDTQVLVKGSHLLREHHLEVACMHSEHCRL